jgi:hypothetical protein
MSTLKLPLEAAALRLGCSKTTPRRRIKAGDILTERERAAGGFRLLVLVDEPDPVVSQQDAENERLTRELAVANARMDTLLAMLQDERERATLLLQKVIQLDSPSFNTANQSGANAAPMDMAPMDSLTTRQRRLRRSNRGLWRILSSL